jgi:hypothetical protein
MECKKCELGTAVVMTCISGSGVVEPNQVLCGPINEVMLKAIACFATSPNSLSSSWKRISLEPGCAVIHCHLCSRRTGLPATARLCVQLCMFSVAKHCCMTAVVSQHLSYRGWVQSFSLSCFSVFSGVMASTPAWVEPHKRALAAGARTAPRVLLKGFYMMFTGCFEPLFDSRTLQVLAHRTTRACLRCSIIASCLFFEKRKAYSRLIISYMSRWIRSGEITSCFSLFSVLRAPWPCDLCECVRAS